jgi:hypothetical protein
MRKGVYFIKFELTNPGQLAGMNTSGVECLVTV